MAKRALSASTLTARIQPITIGSFTLTATGMDVRGRPTLAEYDGVGDFIKQAARASSFWLGDWLAYGESREDWKEKLSQAQDATGLSARTLSNVRAVARGVEKNRRRENVEFSLHDAVTTLPPEEQSEWLERAELKGWTLREFRMEIRAAKRRKVIEGQAVLAGMYRVIYADPPWTYGDRPPSSSGAQQHYPGMTITDLCKLPVKAHALENSVLFMWTTSPMILMNPGPREVIEAWGFTPKANIVWDKVLHGFGHYVEVHHEHLIIATRGSCLPDRPTPMFRSVLTERRTLEHSEKPESVRKMIERLYDGPYVELFARKPVRGWSSFGNDCRLWQEQAAVQAEAERL